VIVQIIDAQPDRLRWPRASDRQRIDEQPELVIECISGADEPAHLAVVQDDVARLHRIRQTGQSDFPRLPVPNPLVVLSRQFQGGEQASADAIDGGGLELAAEQAVAPFPQLGGSEQRDRLGQQYRCQMQAR